MQIVGKELLECLLWRASVLGCGDPAEGLNELEPAERVLVDVLLFGRHVVGSDEHGIAIGHLAVCGLVVGDVGTRQELRPVVEGNAGAPAPSKRRIVAVHARNELVLLADDGADCRADLLIQPSW